jgi:uncharacterized delta-60 repeat protein
MACGHHRRAPQRDAGEDIMAAGSDPGRRRGGQGRGRRPRRGAAPGPVAPLEERALLAAVGGLDPTFGAGGTVRTALGGAASAEVAAAVAVQADGKVVVAATLEDRALAVLRYNPNGTPDLTFGAGGLARLDLGADAVAAGVALDAQGRIVVAGSRLLGGRHQFAVARLAPGGGLDAAFGDAGIRAFDFGGLLDDAQAVALDAQGRVLLAGTTLQGATGFDVAVARLTPAGALDAGFGAGGRRVLHLGGGQDRGLAVAADAQGRVVVAGSTDRGAATGADMAVLRLTAAGDLDPAFGVGGVRTIATGAGDDVARGMALDTRGRIVVAGSTVHPLTQGTDFAVSRLTADGALDAAFGAGGTRTIDLGGTDDRAWAVAADGDDRIVAAGQSNARGVGSDLAVVRLSPAGPLDTAFDADGIQTIDLGTPNDAALAVALGRGRIVVAGATGAAVAAPDIALACLTTEIPPAASPPVARVAPAVGRVAEGGTLTLDATASTDPDAGTGDALSFAWDLDGDGQFDDATGPVATLSALALDGRPGASVSARVRVTDATGLAATAAATIAVDNRPPSLAPISPGVAVRAGAVATQRGTWGDAPADADGVTLVANLGAVLKAADGTWSWSLAATAELAPTTTVRISATDDDGGTSIATFTVATAPAATGGPTIGGIAVDGPAREGTPVGLAVAASHPGSLPLTYAFDWEGDGVYEVSGASATASHVFADDGTYRVGVRVTDRDGGQAVASVAVVVANVAPTGLLSLAPGPDPAEGGALVARLEGVVDPGDDVPRYSFALSRNALAGGYEDAATEPSARLAIPADGAVTVWARVFDEDGGVSESSRSVTVINVAPTPTLGLATGTLVEGAPIALTGAATDPGAGDAVTLSWRVSRAGVPFGPTGTGPAFSFTPDDDGLYVVTLAATDDAGDRREVARTLSVANAAPVLGALGVLAPAREGAPATVVVPANDPAGANDPLSYAFDWEDDGTFEPPGTAAQATRVLADDGTYTVRVRVTDGDGGATTGTIAVVVANVAPAGTLALAPDVLMEGGTLTARLVGVVEPGADTLRYSFALSRESLARSYAEAGPAASATFRPANDGTVTVWARVFDEDGGGSESSRAIKVWNAPPVVAAPVVPASPSRTRTAMTATAAFTDAGRLDWHDAVWEWGDGTTSPATIAESGGSGRASGAHAYLAPGLYRVRLVVRDRDGSAAAATAATLAAVYDPTAGSLGGSGTFASPAGALAANRALAGTATYRLDARYPTTTATVPTGSVSFALAAAKLTFQSTRIEWLAIGGARARLRAEGTINGAGKYGLAVTATDGSRDAIRVRIWNKANGAVVYDNLPLADELSTAASPIASGGVILNRASPPPSPRATLARRLAGASASRRAPLG